MANFAEMRALFRRHGQDHIFSHWQELSEHERECLLADCRLVDFKWLAARQAQLRAAAPRGEWHIAPAPVVRLPRTKGEKMAAQRAKRVGEKALRSGRVAVFVVAGGQGTRLGFDGPKGCYPLGPVSGKTLFQWHAEQILAHSRRHGIKIPWYIMTSRDNDAIIRRYFAEHHYLGFSSEDIMFFAQRMMPALTADGHLLLANKCRLALNPDGHGGALQALARSGALADMKRRGIEIISYFQVDNPLVNICDPVFIGHHLLAQAEMSLKVVEKRAPAEKVGHACSRDGKLEVIEYTEMPRHLTEARDAAGRLRFWAGSIAIHLFQVDFLLRIAAEACLPWHRADKKIPIWRQGQVHHPDNPNGIKFETFIFDALPFARNSMALEVAREEEFAPLKNATGEDSVASCQRAISARFGRWLAAAGARLPHAQDGELAAMVEISPLYALDAAELAKKIRGGIKLERMLALG